MNFKTILDFFNFSIKFKFCQRFQMFKNITIEQVAEAIEGK